MSMVETVHIAPSILAADFTRLGEQIQEAEQAGADWVHIDVMDGRFVPNITMGPLVVEAARRATTLPLDVHLMIIEPERHVEAFAEAGASHITIHVESTPNVHRTLQMIHDLGCKAGIAINPHTPASAIVDLLPMLDIVNVMTVNPGFGGQEFIEETKSKIARLRAMIAEVRRAVYVEVDGGINIETVAGAVQAGANVLVTGTAIFSPQYSVREGIDALRSVMAHMSD
jgi:ribulose-phosphate 3-epimerase